MPLSDNSERRRCKRHGARTSGACDERPTIYGLHLTEALADMLKLPASEQQSQVLRARMSRTHRTLGEHPDASTREG